MSMSRIYFVNLKRVQTAIEYGIYRYLKVETHKADNGTLQITIKT